MALSVWLLNGLNVITGGLGDVPKGWMLSGIADFNDDGTADILWLVNGLSVAGSALSSGPPTDWRVQ